MWAVYGAIGVLNRDNLYPIANLSASLSAWWIFQKERQNAGEDQRKTQVSSDVLFCLNGHWPAPVGSYQSELRCIRENRIPWEDPIPIVSSYGGRTS